MRLIRAFAATMLLLAILAGVPWLLAHTVGNPLHAWPDLAAGDVNDRVVYSVLAAVAWLAWAQFTVAVTVELLSGIRRAPLPRPIPGVFTVQQLTARALITAALMLAPAAITAIAPTAAAVAAIAQPAPAPHPHTLIGAGRPRPAVEPVTATPAVAASTVPVTTVPVTITAGGPHTWWDLAERHLGSGQRWSEIWQLNQGRPEPGGVRLVTPSLLKNGWTILVPTTPTPGTPATGPAHQPVAAAAPPPSPTATPHTRQTTATPTTVTVREGDSLARIGTEHHQNWAELWRANHGRREPGGHTFTDPDHIEPGWTITIPDPPTPPVGGHDITVRGGDTLSQIAADHASTLDAVWTNNEGRAEPDGTLTDPNYLEPGWAITIPTTPPQHRQDTPAAGQPATTHKAAADRRAAATDPAARARTTELETARQAAAEQRADPAAAAAAAGQPTTAEPIPAHAEPRPPAAHPPPLQRGPVPACYR